MIISILGMSGMNREKTEKTTAHYDCSILGKKSDKYHNATDMLLKNYDDTFYFLGTEKAIDFQKKLLKFPEEKVYFLPVEDNSLEDIFEKVYEQLAKAKKNEDIILDITHGFRHQPISAIFSATLHRFLNQKNLRVIFAKQIVEHKEYEYIYLDDYLDITQLSLLLTGFIRTLNFVDSIKVEGFETLPFANFSKALLSNDFYTLQSSYKNLLATIQRAKEDQRFDHLKELFEEIKETLSVFDNFKNLPIYKKYLIISQLMADKNYIMLSLTYLFEAVRFYASHKFYKKGIIKNYAWKNFDKYKLNQDVISYITQKSIDNYRETFYDRTYPQLYKINKPLFERIEAEYVALKELRNKLTHINSEEHSPDIETKLKRQLISITELIDKDVLKDLKLT
jgi:CRISPR-associated DxTHG motif protein